MLVDNPFFHRGAIRRAADFFGRESELAEILTLLRNGQSVSVIGPRRIGKSSLLLHLGRDQVREPFGLQPPNAIFVLIDCQELGGSPPEEVYDALHSGLLNAAEDAGIELPDATGPATYRALDRALYRIKKADRQVVVLLDEFELLAANEQLTPYFFARLRGLTTKYGLAYITASQRPLYAITANEKVLSSPFFNIFVTVSLGLFTQENAKGLLDNRLASVGLSCPAEVCEKVIEYVGAHPFFLHVAGYHAVQVLAKNGGIGDSAELFADFEPIEAAVEIEAESHLAYLWNSLHEDERYALATADGPIDVMRNLTQQCLLTGPAGKYRYTSQILRRFVRRQPVEGLIQANPFVIDPQRHRVTANGEEISLTTSQFSLMTCLARRAGQVVHGSDLELAVWGDVLVDDPDRLKTLIKRLRRALDPYGNWVVSERGVGYALRPPE